MKEHIVILGAGISGLAAGWFLKQYFGSEIKLTILEESSRTGGWIQTIQSKGFLFEQGPRSCRTRGNGQETLALVEALGLRDQVIVPHSDARKRYLLDQNRLKRFPRHLFEIPFNSLTSGWMHALWQDWTRPKREHEDESIQEFFSRRLGKEWAERLIDPFVLGIYAGDCGSLSMKSCFPLFDAWEQREGSLLKGAWRHRPSPKFHSPFIQSIQQFPLFSFQEGMETLPKALTLELNEHILLNQKVIELMDDGHHMQIKLENGAHIKADRVISTLPAPLLRALLHLPGKEGKELNYASVLVVNVGFDHPVLPFKGFGYLVPSKTKQKILGCIWDSSVFPQQNLKKDQTRMTFMLGGMHHPEAVEMADQEIIEYVLTLLNQQLTIRASPQTIQIKRAIQAIPQFEVGFSRWKSKVQEEISHFSPRLILSGTAWSGVAVNDCIAHARQLVAQFFCKK